MHRLIRVSAGRSGLAGRRFFMRLLIYYCCRSLWAGSTLRFVKGILMEEWSKSKLRNVRVLQERHAKGSASVYRNAKSTMFKSIFLQEILTISKKYICFDVN